MNSMVIESLNIGQPKKEIFQDKEIITGICKQPVAGPLQLGQVGFENDGVGDLKHHGGTDKAVCVYSLDHYPYWEKLLGNKLPVPAFGENLTISGLSEDDICIGDIFELGTALLQVSQPRQPCSTLAARFGEKNMVKLVVDSGRTGFYFRVIREGNVEKGSVLHPREHDAASVTVAYANRIFHHERNNCDGIERVLNVPALSASWKKSFRELKDKCI